jgi:hypothetical protein
MKPHIALVCSRLPPNAACRYRDQRLLSFSKYVRNVKKTCVFIEMMSLSPCLFLAGETVTVK